MKRLFIAGVGLFVSLTLLSASALDEPKAKNEASSNELSMDLDVLRTFRTFNFNDDQLKLVLKLSKTTAAPDRKRTPPQTSEALREKIKDLHAALIDDADDEKIDKLEDELSQLTDKEKPELDDSFDTTKVARQHAREVLKSLTVSQLVSYYDNVQEEIVDPRDRLPKLLEEVRELTKSDWRDKRDGYADDIAWAVAGVDAVKGERVSDQVTALLSKARSLSKDEFAAKRETLAKEAAELIGDIGPDDLLRHRAEHAIAELLSNPRLEAAARLKLRLK